MKKLIPILFLFIACAGSQKSEKVIESFPTKADSMKVSFLVEQARLCNNPELLNDSITRVHLLWLDTALKYVNLYKDSIIFLENTQKEFHKINTYNTNAIDSIRLLKQQNVKVVTELHKTKELYSVANSKVVKAQTENEDLKKQRGTPSIAGVEIKCYGFTKGGLFTKVKPFETLIAKDIKRITIQFIVPANEYMDKSTYAFNLKIGTIIRKSLIIKMTGEEIKEEPAAIDIIDLLKPGEYPVTIDVSGKQEYSGNLILK